MADNSAIEWCGPTWNPLAGCTREDTDCDGCYAAAMSLRLEAMARADLAAGRDPGGKRKYIGIATKTPSGRAAFNGTVNLDRDLLTLPFTWKQPRRVFVNSMSDLFHANVPEDFIWEVFAVMAAARQHTFQVLTKRPDRMAELLSRADALEQIQAAGESVAMENGWCHLGEDYFTYPLPNVWLGTSAGFQAAADRRIPHLLRVPAAVRFLSLEPLIGPVDLGRFFGLQDGHVWAECLCEEISPEDRPCLTCEGRLFLGERSGIHWVITGGESGPHARPMHPDWPRGLRDQCVAAGVPFFFKQWGEYQYGTKRPQREADGSISFQDDGMPLYQRVGKKAAGRLLDGQEWNQFPEVHHVGN